MSVRRLLTKTTMSIENKMPNSFGLTKGNDGIELKSIDVLIPIVKLDFGPTNFKDVLPGLVRSSRVSKDFAASLVSNAKWFV